MRRTLYGRLAALVLVASTVLATVSTVTAAPVSAASPTPSYTLTVAARACGAYTDVFANRARNNIMESLFDLGPDSPYTSFTQVQPSVEDGLAPQSNCTALPNWTFALGTGYTRPAAGTNLSYVTGTSTVNNYTITTQASTPLLDSTGRPTGQSIAGAATMTLSAKEAELASNSSRLWIMGGTPSSPLNGQGSTYGFAALRCATDNVNGDNVEWIGYPSGSTHVFCYAFYVEPPTPAGTITVVKQLAAPEPTSSTFEFGGNVSFNPGGAFSLTVPANQTTASVTFTRGSVTDANPWVISESLKDGYDLTDLSCSSSGGSTFSYTSSEASVVLAAGDNVTCTFTNALSPAPGVLGDIAISKQIVVAPGATLPAGALPQSFSFSLSVLQGGTASSQVTVDAGATESPTDVVSGLSSDQWTISEQSPTASPGWTWTPLGADCVPSGGGSPVSVTWPAGSTQHSITIGIGSTEPDFAAWNCVFTNQITPVGSLTVRFTTIGGTGSFGAIISSTDGGTLVQSATTTAAGVATVASGDPSSPLAGTWFVNPIIPEDTAAGSWVLQAAPSCNESSAPYVENVGADQLSVQPSNPVTPDLVCDYVYVFHATPELAATGAVLGPLLLGGSVALLSGALLLIRARRRRSA